MQIPHEFLPVLLVQIALFLGLWIVLKRLWFGPALRVIAAREARSHGAIVEAQRLQAEAERLQREHTAAIDQAKAEAQREVQEIVREAEAEQRRMVVEATEAAQRTITDARERVAREVAEARARLDADVHAIARDVAKAVMGRAV